jgi:hypothetical protein
MKFGTRGIKDTNVGKTPQEELAEAMYRPIGTDERGKPLFPPLPGFHGFLQVLDYCHSRNLKLVAQPVWIEDIKEAERFIPFIKDGRAVPVNPMPEIRSYLKAQGLNY